MTDFKNKDLTKKEINKGMAKGAMWMMLFRLLDRSFGIVSTIILARLLVPEDFGLVALATAVIAILEILTAFSFDLALIQNSQAERKHFDTAWTFNILFAISNAFLLLVFSSPAASFFEDSRLVEIMYVLAFGVFVSGFANIGTVAFQKDLRFDREFKFLLIKRVISFLVTIILAFLLQDYWALVIGTVMSKVAGCILSYAIHPYRPRLCLQAAGQLFHFSKWLVINNILIFAGNRGGDFFIAKLAGPAQLGFFSVAYEISNLPTTELVFPISRAVFPGYARMAAGSRDELSNGYLEVFSLIALITIPAGVGIWVLATPLVEFLLGVKWLDAIPLIKLLAIFGILRACASNSGAAYLALGRPKIISLLSVLYVAVLFLSLLILIPRYRLIGSAYAVLIAATVQMPVSYGILLKSLNIPLKVFLGKIWRPITASLIMAFIVQGITEVSAYIGMPISLILILGVISGVFFYFFCLFILWFFSKRPIGGEAIILEFISKKRHFFDIFDLLNIKRT